MKVLVEGHRYQLDSMEGTLEQSLQFIQKEKVGDKLVTVRDGTTNEEVLRMMLNRLGNLWSIVPSEETMLCIGHVTQALKALEKRTKNREARGVEGTPAP